MGTRVRTRCGPAPSISVDRAPSEFGGEWVHWLALLIDETLLTPDPYASDDAGR